MQSQNETFQCRKLCTIHIIHFMGNYIHLVQWACAINSRDTMRRKWQVNSRNRYWRACGCSTEHGIIWPVMKLGHCTYIVGISGPAWCLFHCTGNTSHRRWRLKVVSALLLWIHHLSLSLHPLKGGGSNVTLIMYQCECRVIRSQGNAFSFPVTFSLKLNI